MNFSPHANPAPQNFPTPRRRPAARIAALAGLAAALLCAADEPPAPGLEDLAWSSPAEMSPAEARLVGALKNPMIHAMNVEKALECWFQGRRADAKGKPNAAKLAWKQGLTFLKNLKPLPRPPWPPPPDGTLKILTRFRYPGAEGTECYIVRWTVDKLTEYGVLIYPQLPPGTLRHIRLPLLLYLHGAAFGVPLYALPWLARMARAGYVIIGPALRGEDLFATNADLHGLNYKCGGKIENLDGEVDDALAAVAGAMKLPGVARDKFGIIGHSFGAGVGLLVAARAPKAACAVSYDAWLVNPFRYYWDRMRRGPNNWLSWEQFCNQPVRAQLAGLMKRSITHHADRIHCPLLLFIGGAYAGSVFHLSHQDFIANLRRYHKKFVYDVVPGGGHNFVLDYDSPQAKYAFEKHMAFLRKYLPPAKLPPAAKPAGGAGPKPGGKHKK